MVAIVGPPPAVALARDLAAALARRQRSTSLVVTWGAGVAARRKRRRIVELAVDREETAGGVELSGALEAWEGGPVVVAICGPRESAFDGLLAGCDLAVSATLTGSPAGLGEAAEFGLAQIAPEMCSVALRRAAPLEPWKYRAAVAGICEALDETQR